MNAIATEAGITKPILYRHFGDKAGLYRALVERHAGELLGQLRVALATRGTRRRRVEATIDAYLRVIEANPALYRFLVHRAVQEEPAVTSSVALFLHRLAEELAAGIRLELDGAAGPAGSVQAVVWAQGIVGMVQQAGDWWLQRRPVPRAVLVEQLTELLWGGLAGAAGSPVR